MVRTYWFSGEIFTRPTPDPRLATSKRTNPRRIYSPPMSSPQGYPGRPARYPAPLVSAAQQSISPEGRAQAEAELKELREVRRPAIVAAIKSAREDGDLSENAEYHTAREEQAMNEARIRTLENLLAAARVVEGETGDGIGVAWRVRARG